MSFDPLGVTDAIKHCFASVFGEINLAGEAWLNKSRLLTIGRDAYADYILKRVGSFPLFGTSRTTTVDDAYVSVRIADEIERDVYRSREMIELSIRQQKAGIVRVSQMAHDPIAAINGSPTGFALLGPPGSGKTTIFRHIALAAARGQEIRGSRRIAVYLAARDLKRDDGVVSAIAAFLERLDVAEAVRVTDMLLRAGKLVVLLDGVDETDRLRQQRLLDEFVELQARHSTNVFCISARPLSLSVGLANFKKWETAPLTSSQRLEFAQKWFNTVDRPKGERLIERCAAEPGLLDLGSNPLLLSILCALFHNELDIPSEPDELYDRAIIGLLGGWDAFRNIARETPLGHLSLRKRTLLCSYVAASLFEHGCVAFSTADLDRAGALKDAASAMQVSEFDASEVLHALYDDFGILVERAPDLYSFSHLTLQEFLVAKFVVAQRTEFMLLNSHRTDPRWSEVIRLTAKLLTSADQFMSDLQRGCRLDEYTQVQLLAHAWLGRPICSIDTRLKLMRDLAARIAGAAKNVMDDVEVRDQRLIIHTRRNPQDMIRARKLLQQAEQASAIAAPDRRLKKEAAAARRTMDGVHDALVMTAALPPMLRVLKASGFSREELRVGDNKLFQAIEDVPNIVDVEFRHFRGEAERPNRHRFKSSLRDHRE